MKIIDKFWWFKLHRCKGPNEFYYIGFPLGFITWSFVNKYCYFSDDGAPPCKQKGLENKGFWIIGSQRNVP